MKRNRFLLLFSAVSLLSFGALAGCDADEDPIVNGDGSGSGSGSGGGDQVACTDGSECADTEVCEAGFCAPAPAMDPYLYVAIVSNASGDDALGTNTPGPDVDAIGLVKGGTDNWAATVEQSGAGEVDADEGNNNDDPALVIGPNDAIPATDGSEECNLAEVGDGGEFHSMGGAGGFVVVSFAQGIEVEDGDILNIWELSDATCSNVSTVRPDAYTVYIGTDASTATSADAITAENGWVQVAASAANGGIVSQTISLGM